MSDFLSQKIVEEIQGAEKTIENNINMEVPGAEDTTPTRQIFTKFDILAPIDQEHHIEYYKNHVLNFNKSDGMAHIIRGVTSIVGEVNFAVFDILIGIYKLYKPKKEVA